MLDIGEIEIHLGKLIPMPVVIYTAARPAQILC